MSQNTYESTAPPPQHFPHHIPNLAPPHHRHLCGYALWGRRETAARGRGGGEERGGGETGKGADGGIRGGGGGSEEKNN